MYCYDERMFPSVSAIDVVDGNLHATLGQQWYSNPESWSGDGNTTPTVVYDPENARWSLGPRKSVPAPWAGTSHDSCAKLIPPIGLSAEEVFRLRPSLLGTSLPRMTPIPITQEIGACHRSGDVIWFGISFYEGEGVTGVGGVGRYDLQTKQIEIRRPVKLRGVSANHIFVDGSRLWIGTTGRGECVGQPATERLVVYDWESDRTLNLGQHHGMCGFVVHGLELVGDDLWVASDLGMSVGRKSPHSAASRRWEHFVPRPDAKVPVQRVQCQEIYRDLLDRLPYEGDENVAVGMNFYRLFFQNLMKFHPLFVEQYVAEKTGKLPPAPSKTPR